MKIRNGFVSNSSSSSFICDITGEEVQGWDLCLEDAGMYQCVNDHYFMEEFLVGDLPEESDEYEGGRWEIPAENCPICSFKYIEEDKLVMYIETAYNIKSSEVFDYMKSTNRRLRKLRNRYWFEYLEKEQGVSKLQLETRVKSKYSGYEEFENSLRGTK